MPNEHTPEPSKTAGETFDLHKALVDALPDYQIGVQGWFAEEKKPRWSVTVGGECGQRTLVRVGVGFNATPLYSRGEALRAALAALGDASLTRAEHQAIDRVAAMTSYHDFRVRPVPYPGDGPGAVLGSRLYPLHDAPHPPLAAQLATDHFRLNDGNVSFYMLLGATAQVRQLHAEALEKIKKAAAYEPGDTKDSIFAQGQESAYGKVLTILVPQAASAAQPAPAPASGVKRWRRMLAVRCPDGTVAREHFWLSAEEKRDIKRMFPGSDSMIGIVSSPADEPTEEENEKRTGADAALGWLDARMNPKVAPAPEAAPVAVGSPLVPTFWPVPVPEAPTPEAPAPKLHKLEVTEEELQLLFAGLEEIHAAGQEVKAAMLTHKLISQSGQIRTNLADAEPNQGEG